MSKAPARQRPDSPERARDRAVDSRVVGALLVTFGAAWLADSTGAVDMGMTGMLAAVLVALGVSMVVTARQAGSSARLIVLGVILTVALAVTSVQLPSARGGVGERYYLASAADVQPGYRQFAGEMIINLAEVPLEDLDRAIDVRITFGEVDIIVPDDMRVRVDYRMTGGEAQVLGRTQEGMNIRDQVTDGEGNGLLTLRVRASFGTIDIRRESDAPGGWLRGRGGDVLNLDDPAPLLDRHGLDTLIRRKVDDATR